MDRYVHPAFASMHVNFFSQNQPALGRVAVVGEISEGQRLIIVNRVR